MLNKFIRNYLQKVLLFIWLPALLFSLTSFTKYNRDPSVPQTFVVSGAFLLNSKNKIKKGDKVLIEALKKLTENADKALTKGPYSVTYKTKVPPGGDRHDYMSVGPYWWPDSTKTDGLPYSRNKGQ